VRHLKTETKTEESSTVSNTSDYDIHESGSSASASNTQESTTETQQQQQSGIDIELTGDSTAPADSTVINIVKTDSGYSVKSKGQKIKHIHINEAETKTDKSTSKLSANQDSSAYSKAAAGRDQYDSAGKTKIDAKAAGSSITETHIPWPGLAGLAFMMFCIWYAWHKRDYIISKFMR